jgi:hypothetical protein
MTKSKAIKGFDCVEMKHKAQERIYEATKGMSSKQRVQYFHDQANNGKLGEWWRGLGKRTAKAA